LRLKEQLSEVERENQRLLEQLERELQATVEELHQ